MDLLPRDTMQEMDAADAVAEVIYLKTLEQVFR